LRTVQELVEEDLSAVLIGFAFHYFYSIFGFRYWIVGQNMGGYQLSSQPTHCLEIVKNSIAIFIPLQLSLSLVPPSQAAAFTGHGGSTEYACDA